MGDRSDAVETGTRRGTDNFQRAISRVFEGWDASRSSAIQSGDDVVALGRLRTRGQVGLEVTGEHAEIWSFEDGEVTRMRWLRTHAEALAAAKS